MGSHVHIFGIWEGGVGLGGQKILASRDLRMEYL